MIQDLYESDTTSQWRYAVGVLAYNEPSLALSCHFYKELGSLDCIIISSRPLSVVQDLPLVSFTFSFPHVSLSQRTCFPSFYSCYFCLFPPPLKCRNPSTAFYQAFRPSRLRGSKPVNDRYGLGCVYLCGVCVAWPG